MNRSRRSTSSSSSSTKIGGSPSVPSISPSGKKLIQSRLSFFSSNKSATEPVKTIATVQPVIVVADENEPKQATKRKLSLEKASTAALNVSVDLTDDDDKECEVEESAEESVVVESEPIFKLPINKKRKLSHKNEGKKKSGRRSGGKDDGLEKENDLGASNEIDTKTETIVSLSDDEKQIDDKLDKAEILKEDKPVDKSIDQKESAEVMEIDEADKISEKDSLENESATSPTNKQIDEKVASPKSTRKSEETPQINSNKDEPTAVSASPTPDDKDETEESEKISVKSPKSKVDESPDKKEEESICLSDDEPAKETKIEVITPKRTRSLAEGAAASPQPAKLTPKQLQRKKESEQRLLLKQKEREEKEEQRRKEKEERDRKKQAEIDARKKREEQKEEERKKREEQREEERKKREEQKEEERKKREEQKEEEKRQREEERKKKEEQKEEERRKREEERNAKEMADKLKNQKMSRAFTNFFAKKPEATEKQAEPVEKTNFMPFRCKEDMRVAPNVRRTLSEMRRKLLEEIVLHPSEILPEKENLYLKLLRSGSTVPDKDGKTWPLVDSSDDIMIVENELEGASAIIEEPDAKEQCRAKFFKFEENQRPAYRGTWRKTSKLIKPRRPFATDNTFFDYTVDSDDEWEEEEPGESLRGSDDEKDKESDDDDYDIDNEFFVPHGHLSDTELQEEDEMDEDNSPDAQKAKLKIIQKEFADEMKKKTEKIKPRLIGTIWQNADGTQPESCPKIIWDTLRARAAIFIGLSVAIRKQIVVDGPGCAEPNGGGGVAAAAAGCGAEENGDVATPSNFKSRTQITEDVVADLIRLVHGNANNQNFIVQEFRAYLSKKNGGDENLQNFSNTSIRSKMKEIAEYGPCREATMNKYCWYVSQEKRLAYGITDLGLPNTWTYILKPKRSIEASKKPMKIDSVEQPAETTPAVSPVSTASSTTKSPTSEPVLSNATPNAKSGGGAKKRVNILMSVPRGEEIPKKAKNLLITQYLESNLSKKLEPAETPAKIIPMDVDNVIVLDE